MQMTYYLFDLDIMNDHFSVRWLNESPRKNKLKIQESRSAITVRRLYHQVIGISIDGWEAYLIHIQVS